MKRTMLFALMITLLLTGCGGEQDEEAVLELQRRLTAAESFAFTAEIAAGSESEAVEFTALCRCSGGVTEATLTAPELLRGVSFRTEAGDTAIVYDGVLLSLGGVTREGLSPCALLPLLTEAMAAGRILLTWREQGALAVELESGEGQSVRLWFSPEMIPERAEFTEDGRTVLRCDITNWKVEA